MGGRHRTECSLPQPHLEQISGISLRLSEWSKLCGRPESLDDRLEFRPADRHRQCRELQRLDLHHHLQSRASADKWRAGFNLPWHRFGLRRSVDRDGERQQSRQHGRRHGCTERRGFNWLFPLVWCQRHDHPRRHQWRLLRRATYFSRQPAARRTEHHYDQHAQGRLLRQSRHV